MGINLSFYLPEEVVSAFNDEAERQLRSQSNMAELIFREYLTKKKKLKKQVPEDPRVDKIFQYWKMRMGKSNQTKLTPGRASKIRARLKDYSLEDIKMAIDGCAKSPHHMGQNSSGTVYDDLTLICRNGEKLEQFMRNIGKVTPNEESRPDSAVDRVEQAIRKRQAERQHHGEIVVENVPPVRHSMDDQLRIGTPGRVGEYVEGDYTTDDG